MFTIISEKFPTILQANAVIARFNEAVRYTYFFGVIHINTVAVAYF
jgi:hypothetical protein